MTLVKICGINDRAGAEAAREADYLGFNFFPRSPRFVSPAEAAALVQPGPASVGLFVAPGEAEIAAVLAVVRLDILQIYADAASCRTIREKFGVKVWRAVGVAGVGDLPRDDEGLDGFVIEAKPPEGASRPGGNAQVLDWRLLKGWRAPSPWLLAGGLTPQNTTAAIASSGAPGVDVSSGVEEAAGQKSPALIRAFISAARSAPALHASGTRP